MSTAMKLYALKKYCFNQVVSQLK